MFLIKQMVTQEEIKVFVECKDGEDKAFPFDQGASFNLFFKDENGNKIKDLAWIGVNTAESWNYVLLTNTPLGHLTIDGSDSKVFYDLCVKDIRGKTMGIENNHAEFFYPHMFMKHTSINIEDVIAWQKAEIGRKRWDKYYDKFGSQYSEDY